jgi:hypothetical protein
MKKLTIRATKLLGDISVEGGCSACTGVVLRAEGSGYRPNREEFQKSIQAQFDEVRLALRFPAGGPSLFAPKARTGLRQDDVSLSTPESSANWKPPSNRPKLNCSFHSHTCVGRSACCIHCQSESRQSIFLESS